MMVDWMRSSYPTIRHDTPRCVSPLAIRCRSLPLCSLSPTARSLTHSSVGLLPRRGQQGGTGRGKVRCSAMETHTHTHTARSSAVCHILPHHITFDTFLSLSLSLAPQTRSLVQPRRQGVRERRVSNDQSCPLSLCVARVIPSVRGVDRVTNPKM